MRRAYSMMLCWVLRLQLHSTLNPVATRGSLMCSAVSAAVFMQPVGTYRGTLSVFLAVGIHGGTKTNLEP